MVRRARRWERTGYLHVAGLGDRVECPQCGWTGFRFAPSAKPRRANRICPRCLSNERYRAFDSWFRARPGTGAGSRLLEIAPTDHVAGRARALGYDYMSLDLRSAKAAVLGDLCKVPFVEDVFDVTVCFHVLEHIPDDGAAMSELGRITAAQGDLVVVVPWEPDRPTTFEDPTVDPADYEAVFGQSDHVRIYGADFASRLRDAGLEVEEVRWSTFFSPDEFRRLALDGDDDRFWICRRSVDG